MEVVFSPGNEGTIILNFDFHLVESPMDRLSVEERAEPGNFMALDANLKIKYNNTIYFDEDIAILEFWLQLNDWLNGSNNDEIQYHIWKLKMSSIH